MIAVVVAPDFVDQHGGRTAVQRELASGDLMDGVDEGLGLRVFD